MLLTETGRRARDSVCWGIFADGCCTVAATKQRCTPRITGAESKEPKIPQQSCVLLALPRAHLWGPCPSPVFLCPLASQGITITLQGVWRCSEAPWLSLALGDRHPARLGPVGCSERDVAVEVADVELAKKINILHHTSEMWPAEMLLFPVTEVRCDHSFRAAGWW